MPCQSRALALCMARPSDPRRAQAAATWIVRRLRDAGHVAYFAGGCVRDGLLGLHPTDFDVATDAAPARVRAIFPRTSVVGAAFGVVLVYVSADAIASEGVREPGPSVSVEVATFRSDGPYSDARRPDTIRFSDAKSDAERRDFTINALFLDPLDTADDADARLPRERDLHGRIIDYVGGRDDLSAKVLRAVGDPDRRLFEDHLRALRAVRFAARLSFTMEQGTAAAITRHASELRGVSRERIGEELRRMLAHPQRADAVRMLQELGLDAPVLLDESRHADLPRVRGLSPGAPGVVALAAWTLDRMATAAQPWFSDHDAGLIVSRLRRALCLSNQETEDLNEVFHCVRGLIQTWEAESVAWRKRLAGKPLFPFAIEIVAATHADFARRVSTDVEGLRHDGIGISPPILVTGDDLVAHGFVPGPNFRRILDTVRDAQLEGRVGTKQAGVELARQLSV